MEIFLFISIFFLILYVGLILICTIGWTKLHSYSPEIKSFNTKISIIISARNEEHNILNCLGSIVKQNYPKELLEIIVVDDHSTDNTKAVVEKISLLNPRIKLIPLTVAKGKKSAIAEGIKNSSGTLIITTDADCIAPENWVSTIASFYEECHPKMIIAPVAFHNEQSVFEKMQSVEFAGLTATTGATCYFNKLLMCNGANLAYEKQAFIDVESFKGIDNNLSGDDVLLMFKFEKKYPKEIKFLKSREVIVLTEAKKNIKEFINQRVRWASKSLSQVNSTYILTGLIISGFNLCVIISLVISLFNPAFFRIFLILFWPKCIIDFLFLILATSFFNKKRYLLYFIPQQLLYIFYINAILFLGLFGKKYTWKGRDNTNK